MFNIIVPRTRLSPVDDTCGNLKKKTNHYIFFLKKLSPYLTLAHLSKSLKARESTLTRLCNKSNHNNQSIDTTLYV